MKKLVLYLLLFCICNYCFSQTQKHGFEVVYSDENYLIKGLYPKIFVKPNYYYIVEFSDWRFVDSLKFKLREFYRNNIVYDTLGKYIGGVDIFIDALGDVVYSSVLIPEEYQSFFSLEKIKRLNELLATFHFHLPEYEKIRRYYKNSVRQDVVNTFDFLNITYTIKSNGIVRSAYDGRLNRQLDKMVIGIWRDIYGKEFIFYWKKEFDVFVKMLHPLKGIPGNFHINFRGGMFYIDLGSNKEYLLNYVFSGDHLTLSGDIEGRAVKWELTREEHHNKD